jgi:hypothetical protein
MGKKENLVATEDSNAILGRQQLDCRDWAEGTKSRAVVAATLRVNVSSLSKSSLTIS